MKVKKEEYFPRGSSTTKPRSKDGRRPPDTGNVPRIHNLFTKKMDRKTNEANGSGNVKSLKRKSSNALTAEEQEFLATDGKGRVDELQVDEVSFETITEDFLTLGRVKKVTLEKLTVDLPGRLVGEVPVRNISKHYTAILKTVASGVEVNEPWYTLQDMFVEGQLVVATVRKFERRDNDFRKFVILSLDPSHINKNYLPENIEEGTIFTAAVKSIEDHGYIMDLGIPGVRAFLKKENAKSFIKHVSNNKPLGIGQLVECQITTCTKSDRCANVQLTADPKTLHKYVYPDEANLNYELLLPGMAMEAIVMKIAESGLQVHVQDLIGVIHKFHMTETWKPPTKFEIGEKVVAHVLYKFPTGTVPHLSLKPKLFPHSIVPFTPSLQLGSLASVTVTSVSSTGLIVRSETGDRGLISLARCSDELITYEEAKKQFGKGTSHKCRITGYNLMDNFFFASFQPSLLASEICHPVQVVPGVVVDCTISKWNPVGAVVTFGLSKGLIPKHHFGNIPFRNPEEKFPVGTKIQAKVISKNETSGRVFLTAKKELVKSKDPVVTNMSDVENGTVLKGSVKSVNQGGVVLELIGGVYGFVPRRLLGITVDKLTPLESMYFVGRLLTAQVVSCKPEQNELILSLEIRSKETKKRTEPSESVQEKSNENDVEPLKKKPKVTDVANTELDHGQPEEEKKVVKSKLKASVSDLVDKEGLKLPSSSFWDVGNQHQESSSALSYKAALDEQQNETSEKKGRISNGVRKRMEEERIRNLEQAMADYKTNLKTEDDCERLVLASPNSSMCWIQFMAFYLQNENVPKAKEVGMRALKTILYREEQERLNVWVALLNLENKYGTSESLDAVFEEAVRNNDEFKVYTVMADIFVESNKHEEAEGLYKKMVKKFRDLPAPYAKYGQFLYSVNRSDDARQLFKKSLLTLNPSQHLQLIAKNCQLELLMGDIERGKTMFDQLLGAYPKRTDIWLMYANLLAKVKDSEGAISVLKRALDVGFPPKNARTLLTRLEEIDQRSRQPNPEAMKELAAEYEKRGSLGKKEKSDVK